MNYQQAKDKIYILMNYCTFDESAIEDLFWFGVEDIKNNEILTLSQKKYLCDKIDNFHLQYYNIIRSLYFFKLNNNFKSRSNYLLFIHQYYNYIEIGKTKGAVLTKLLKDLIHRKNVVKEMPTLILTLLVNINI